MANVKAPMWETFDHMADIGIRGYGRTMEEAFENGARALFSILVEDLSEVLPEVTEGVSCSSFDVVGLFVAWINELIALADIKQMVFSEFKTHIAKMELTGTAAGQKWDLLGGHKGIEVKGATFTEALVEKREGLWIAQCVVDV